MYYYVCMHLPSSFPPPFTFNTPSPVRSKAPTASDAKNGPSVELYVDDKDGGGDGGDEGMGSVMVKMVVMMVMMIEGNQSGAVCVMIKMVVVMVVMDGSGIRVGLCVCV
jgi:hypothetical protein